jgi:aspartate kinase
MCWEGCFVLIVQKYGGTSLGDTERVRAAARRLTGLAKQGIRVVAVVSAQGDMTDMLIDKAVQVNRRGSAREMDAYLAAGEQMSAGLLAMAIGSMGYPAVSLTGWQAGIGTDGVHGNAKIQNVGCQRILQELDAGKIVVVAGFQGVDPEGDITTLGRGGSDTTAVALAAFLKADKCQIFTDVDGVYDRDPRLYSDATRFGRITYGKMMELIENGAQVLHDRSVELARDYGIQVEVLSAFTGEPGTIVGELE